MGLGKTELGPEQAELDRIRRERDRAMARYLRELAETWHKAAQATGRQLVADALFDRVEVLGLREATLHLSARAATRVGVGAAGGVRNIRKWSGREVSPRQTEDGSRLGQTAPQSPTIPMSELESSAR